MTDLIPWNVLRDLPDPKEYMNPYKGIYYTYGPWKFKIAPVITSAGIWQWELWSHEPS